MRQVCADNIWRNPISIKGLNLTVRRNIIADSSLAMGFLMAVPDRTSEILILIIEHYIKVIFQTHREMLDSYSGKDSARNFKFWSRMFQFKNRKLVQLNIFKKKTLFVDTNKLYSLLNAADFPKWRPWRRKLHFQKLRLEGKTTEF